MKLVQTKVDLEHHRERVHDNELEHKLQEAPSVDIVTGLCNRRDVDARRALEWSRSRRHDIRLSCLVIGLEGLEEVRHRAGEAAGEHALRAVADLLRSLRRGPDMLGRHDGDCFVLVALHCDRSGAESLARRILQGPLGLPPPYASASVPWRARIGISTDRSPLVEDPKDLVDEGWKALEEAKRHANDVAFSEEPT